MSSQPIRVLCVGAGHMGRSHALAYHEMKGFEICGIVTRSPESRQALNEELGGGYELFGDFETALKEAPRQKNLWVNFGSGSFPRL